MQSKNACMGEPAFTNWQGTTWVQPGHAFLANGAYWLHAWIFTLG